jgi:hypothetical protein
MYTVNVLLQLFKWILLGRSEHYIEFACHERALQFLQDCLLHTTPTNNSSPQCYNLEEGLPQTLHNRLTKAMADALSGELSFFYCIYLMYGFTILKRRNTLK